MEHKYEIWRPWWRKHVTWGGHVQDTFRTRLGWFDGNALLCLWLWMLVQLWLTPPCIALISPAAISLIRTASSSYSRQLTLLIEYRAHISMSPRRNHKWSTQQFAPARYRSIAWLLLSVINQTTRVISSFLNSWYLEHMHEEVSSDVNKSSGVIPAWCMLYYACDQPYLVLAPF